MVLSDSSTQNPTKTRLPWGVLAIWIILHVIAFPVGTALRGSDPNSLVGNALFGLTFGAVQAIVLVITARMTLATASIWSAASSLCFTIGTRLASRVSLTFTSETALVALIYGFVVGTLIGSLQVILLRPHTPRFLLWWAVSTIAWMAGESVAFGTQFVNEGIPFVGLAIGVVSGLGLYILPVSKR